MFKTGLHLIIFGCLCVFSVVGDAKNKKEMAIENPPIQTFTFCTEVSPQTFNPQLATDAATFNASAQTIYDRLVTFEGDFAKIVPGLAKSWKVSSDGRKVTFYLRDDVRFHTTEYFKPTRNMNSEDVIFSFDRMRLKTHPFHSVGGGDYPSFSGQQLGDLIEKIEKVDDYVVRFTLRRPEAPFLANMAMDFASILSAEYAAKLIAEKKLENMDALPIGTGPFIFASFEKDQTIHYVSNAQYFSGSPKIDQLVFLIEPSPKRRLAHIKSGTCHFMNEPQPESIPEIRKDAELRLLQQPGLNIAYLAMNNKRSPFEDRMVRLAVHHALDRQNYIKEVYGGHAQVAKNPLPPRLWSYNRTLQDYEYNVAKAKAALLKSSQPNGFKTELWYPTISRSYNPNAKKMANLIQQDLKKIGIEVRLVEKEWGEFLAQSKKGVPAMSLQGWMSDNGDPDNFLNQLLSCQAIDAGNNRAQWCDRKFSFLIERARVTPNIRIRTDFYERAQKIFKTQVPWVTLAHAIEFKVARKSVSGYQQSPFGIMNFYKVSLK